MPELDPADARLLATIAESGRAAIPEIAGRLGIDPAWVATRLLSLASDGLPIVVGVECDRAGIAAALRAPEVTQPVRPPVPIPVDPVTETWGPPQTAGWARGDPRPRQPPPTPRVGAAQPAHGPSGEPLTARLVELVDPADALLTSTGYRLPPGNRAVVAHTEVTNNGSVPLRAAADDHLVLVTTEGATIGKSTITLASRPAHRPGLLGGLTASGHGVFLLPDAATVTSVRWSLHGAPGAPPATWTVPAS